MALSRLRERLACIAHKCLDISERCRLWQQDIPATPEHPAAVFLKKGFKNKLFNQHFRNGPSPRPFCF
jgi:hypothetical protein